VHECSETISKWHASERTSGLFIQTFFSTLSLSMVSVNELVKLLNSKFTKVIEFLRVQFLGLFNSTLIYSHWFPIWKAGKYAITVVRMGHKSISTCHQRIITHKNSLS